MSGSASASHVAREWFSPGWLPPGGVGNGLSGSAWAPIADVEPAMVRPLLDAFTVVGVPAYAAPVPRSLRTKVRGRPAAHWRMWVAVSNYAAAERTLVNELDRLVRGGS